MSNPCDTCVLSVAVNTDGKLVARLDQQVDRDANGYDSPPVTRVRTEVDIPSQGVHQTVTKETGQDTVITDNGNRRAISPDINQDINNNVRMTLSLLLVLEMVYVCSKLFPCFHFIC